MLANDGYLLTPAEIRQYAIPKKPLTYDRYLALIDIDAYKRTHDRLLFLVMRFSLESLGIHKIPVHKEDILRIYESQIGLEPFAAPLLAGLATSADIMRLMQTYHDERLLRILPPPASNDKAYLAFLAEQARNEQWSIYTRMEVFKQLNWLEDDANRKAYRDFLIASLKKSMDDDLYLQRESMYEGLVQLKDEDALAAIRQALLEDPVTNCRQYILFELRQYGIAAPVMDALVSLASGQGQPHHEILVPSGPGRIPGVDPLTAPLRDYLAWARSQTGLDAPTRTKVDQALAKIAGPDPSVRTTTPSPPATP